MQPIVARNGLGAHIAPAPSMEEEHEDDDELTETFATMGLSMLVGGIFGHLASEAIHAVELFDKFDEARGPSRGPMQNRPQGFLGNAPVVNPRPAAWIDPRAALTPG